MIVRPIGVRVLLFTLFLAAPCRAQDAPAPTPAPVSAPDSLVTPEPEQAAPAPAPAPAPAAPAPAAVAATAPKAAETSKSFPHHGGIGGLIGGSYFYAAEDYSKGAHTRFDFGAQFRYVFNPTWRLQVSPGFTWSAYSKNEQPPFVDPKFPEDTNKQSYLTLLIPVSAQMQWVWGKSHWLYHVGAGPGIYRVWIENHRKVLLDPVTLRLHRGNYAGFAAEFGAERFLKSLPKTSIEVQLVHHRVFTTRDDQFPSGWNSTISALALRVGANYYFDLNKPKKTTELPPGIK